MGITMRIDSPCTSIARFIESYHPFCAPTSCFLPSADVRAIGEQAQFIIRLADGTPVLRGTCTVLGAWQRAENPFGRPGMHIGLVELAPESRATYDRLLVAGRRTAASNWRTTVHERDLIASLLGMVPLRRPTERTEPLVIPLRAPAVG